MTTKRRRSSGSDSSSRPSTPDAPTRRLGGGNGDATTVNLDALDTMTTRLNNTGGRVDAVGNTVRGINVGPQSMGVVGGNFTGAAQNHLRTAQEHVGKARSAVDNAQAGTKATVKLYRDNEQAQKVNFDKLDPPAPPRAVSTPNPPNNQPSITDRLNPPPDPNAPYQPSRRERYLQQRKIVSMEPMGGPGNVNETYRARLDDGTEVVYKPESGEATNNEFMRNSISGDLGRREMAGSRVDDMLGFGLVPATTMLDGPDGPGSAQMFADGSTDGREAHQYGRVEQQQMAVLDYVTGNTDRHSENYLTGPDGKPVAIDHGFCFPDERGGRDVNGDPIRSDFVAENINTPLEPSVLNAVNAVDPADMRRMLADSGLSDTAITHTLNRLDEIQRTGMITGEAHGRYLVTGSGALVYEDYYRR